MQSYSNTHYHAHTCIHTLPLTCSNHKTCNNLGMQAAKKSSAPEGLRKMKFPPSLARTMFIDEFSAGFGVLPKDWAEGAANIMGNTVPQWSASYAPRRKSRMAQRAIAAHQQLRGKARAARAAMADMGGEEDMEWELAGLPRGVPRMD